MNPDVLRPGPRENSWRAQQGLDGKFVVLFSGSQGYNQDIRVILDAAHHLQSEPDIEFVLVGDGTQHEEMVACSRQMGLNNVRWLDWQPDEVYPMMLQAADVVLATLRDQVKTPVVPSKILSAMAAGRPVVTCAPVNGDAPRVVMRAQGGVTLHPGDARRLATTLAGLSKNPDLCRQFGVNARRYIEEHLDVRIWAKAHVDLFSALTASRGRPQPRPSAAPVLAR
jgi:glycosyltransferase involved in cell wall biosynthesis